MKFSYLSKDSLVILYKYYDAPELARWYILDIDGRKIKTIVSSDYNFCENIIKKKFNVKKVVIHPIPHENVFSDDMETFVDHKLTRTNKILAIKAIDEDNYILSDLQSIINSIEYKILDFNMLPAYKAKVSFVSPACKRISSLGIPNPFFGISLQNSNFIRPKLLACLEWISQKYKRCTVLIGDSIHRITLQHSENLNESDALSQAVFLGKKFFQSEKTIFELFEERCKFDFIFCSDIQEYDDYKWYHNSIKNLFLSNEDFRNSVVSFSEKYHLKKYHFVSKEHWDRLIFSSCEYFLEEFAIFSCLCKRGISVMIYPGSFSTLSEIADGQYPDIVKELKDLTIISLYIKKK